MGLETTLVLCRFVHNTSTMFLWGAFAYLALLVPKPLALEIGERLRPASGIAVFLAIGTIFAALPLQAGMIGQGWSDAVDLGTIRDVLLETSVGRGWAIQVAAALLLLPALALSPRRASIALAMASGLLLASLAFSGHATMREGWIGAGHRFNDMVHVLSGGAWIGALIPVVLILGRLRQVEWRVAAQTALMRFSSAGHAAVALVIASGVVNTTLVLRRLPADWTSPYQALLALKIILVIVLTGLALINRYVFVPRMRTSEAGSIRAIRLGTLTEIALGIVVLGLVAWFGMLEPV